MGDRCSRYWQQGLRSASPYGPPPPRPSQAPVRAGRGFRRPQPARGLASSARRSAWCSFLAAPPCALPQVLRKLRRVPCLRHPSGPRRLVPPGRPAEPDCGTLLGFLRTTSLREAATPPCCVLQGKRRSNPKGGPQAASRSEVVAGARSFWCKLACQPGRTKPSLSSLRWNPVSHPWAGLGRPAPLCGVAPEAESLFVVRLRFAPPLFLPSLAGLLGRSHSLSSIGVFVWYAPRGPHESVPFKLKKGEFARVGGVAKQPIRGWWPRRTGALTLCVRSWRRWISFVGSLSGPQPHPERPQDLLADSPVPWAVVSSDPRRSSSSDGRLRQKLARNYVTAPPSWEVRRLVSNSFAASKGAPFATCQSALDSFRMTATTHRILGLSPSFWTCF